MQCFSINSERAPHLRRASCITPTSLLGCREYDRLILAAGVWRITFWFFQLLLCVRFWAPIIRSFKIYIHSRWFAPTQKAWREIAPFWPPELALCFARNVTTESPPRCFSRFDDDDSGRITVKPTRCVETQNKTVYNLAGKRKQEVEASRSPSSRFSVPMIPIRAHDTDRSLLVGFPSCRQRPTTTANDVGWCSFGAGLAGGWGTWVYVGFAPALLLSSFKTGSHSFLPVSSWLRCKRLASPGVLSVLNRPGVRRVERSFSIPLAAAAAGCSSYNSRPSRTKTDPTQCLATLPKVHPSELFRLLLVVLVLCKRR